jgi:hypothetical protein
VVPSRTSYRAEPADAAETGRLPPPTDTGRIQPGERPPQPDPTRPRQRATPPPAATRSATPAGQSRAGSPSVAHDPGGDLALAMVGTAGSLLGALVLVAAFGTFEATIPYSTLLLLALGMLLAFGGGLSTLLVILTGGRGRRAARPIVSMILGSTASVGVTALACGLFIAKDVYLSPATEEVAVAPILAPATPVGSLVASTAPPATDVVVDDEPPEPEPVVADADVEPPPTRREIEITQPSAYTPTASRAATPTPPEPEPERVASVSTPASASTARAAPPPETPAAATPVAATPVAATPAIPENVPLEVIDIMLRNSVGVKKCIFYHQRETGSLPTGLKLQFTIDPSGEVHSAGISGAYSGTELDTCLSGTVEAITMPPSSGTTKITYPFKF